MLKHINVKSRQRVELIDITPQVKEELKESGLASGVCHVFVPHTTAGISINEGADPSVKTDICTMLERLIPKSMHYHHLEGNSDAHIKTILTGTSVTIPVEQGALLLGTWQAVFFCEYDGPRHRRVSIKFIPDK